MRTPLLARPATWGWSLAIWTVPTLVVVSQIYTYALETGTPLPLGRIVANAEDLYLWALFTPFILELVARFPVTRESWKRYLPLHLTLGFVAAFVFVSAAVRLEPLLEALLRISDRTKPPSSLMFFRVYVASLVNYWEIVAIGHAFVFYRDSRETELRASELQGQLTKAELQVLRMQLHPHFLFNTLHTISALMHKNVAAADRMITLLGDLLRLSLESKGASVSLKQELSFLDRYLEIERTRFQDRLTVRMDIDPGALDGQVPNLILQPLVENAIRHGVGRRSSSGLIELTARREGDRLAVSIKDDGPGLTNDGPHGNGNGVGLANTQARLVQLYGATHRFELRNRAEGGLEVQLEVPFRTLDRLEPRPPIVH